MPQFYTWSLELRVPNTAVARASTREVIDTEGLAAFLSESLGVYADEPNFGVKVKSAPKQSDIDREQS